MQLSVSINNNNIAENILWFLNSFSSQGVVVKIDTKNSVKELLTDEYIEENWEKILSKSLENYDESYYKSDQYKLDRGKYLMEKYK
jgi:imidazole glycerol phosphate synthase subunit HisF